MGKKLTIPRSLAAAVAYLALVGVVIYGTKDHVYDGFGKAVPWLIAGVFIAMSAIRFYEYALSVRAQKSVDRFRDARGGFGDGDDEEDGGAFADEEEEA